MASAVKREEMRVEVDEMKKRAIVSARSYDEFKGLVACAHQTRVTPDEMKDFTTHSHKRRDVNAVAALRAVGASVVRDEAAEDEAAAAASAALTGVADGTIPGPPRNIHELERDLKRLRANSMLQLRYLLSLKPKRTKRVFSAHIDAAVLSSIISALTSSFVMLPEHRRQRSAARKLARLLGAVARAPSFSMTADFLTSDDKAAATAVVDAVQPAMAAKEGDQGDAELEEGLRAFQSGCALGK